MSLRPVGTLTGHQSGVNSVAFNPDGTMLASAGNDDKAMRWNVGTQQRITTLTAADNVGVASVSFSHDGKTLATGGEDVELWSVGTWQKTDTLPVNNDVMSMAFTRDGHRLACSTYDGRVMLWNLSTGQATLLDHDGPAVSVALIRTKPSSRAPARTVSCTSGTSAQPRTSARSNFPHICTTILYSPWRLVQTVKFSLLQVRTT
jgi:WD40 repeat protein